jgi:hypothetical protein
MVEKAAFLLRDVRASRESAVRALEQYFPRAPFEERLRCVYQARDLRCRRAPPTWR